MFWQSHYQRYFVARLFQNMVRELTALTWSHLLYFRDQSIGRKEERDERIQQRGGGVWGA